MGAGREGTFCFFSHGGGALVEVSVGASWESCRQPGTRSKERGAVSWETERLGESRDDKNTISRPPGFHKPQEGVWQVREDASKPTGKGRHQLQEPLRATRAWLQGRYQLWPNEVWPTRRPHQKREERMKIVAGGRKKKRKFGRSGGGGVRWRKHSLHLHPDGEDLQSGWLLLLMCGATRANLVADSWTRINSFVR